MDDGDFQRRIRYQNVEKELVCLDARQSVVKKLDPSKKLSPQGRALRSFQLLNALHLLGHVFTKQLALDDWHPGVKVPTAKPNHVLTLSALLCVYLGAYPLLL